MGALYPDSNFRHQKKNPLLPLKLEPRRTHCGARVNLIRSGGSKLPVVFKNFSILEQSFDLLENVFGKSFGG